MFFPLMAGQRVAWPLAEANDRPTLSSRAKARSKIEFRLPSLVMGAEVGAWGRISTGTGQWEFDVGHGWEEDVAALGPREKLSRGRVCSRRHGKIGIVSCQLTGLRMGNRRCPQVLTEEKRRDENCSDRGQAVHKRR